MIAYVGWFILTLALAATVLVAAAALSGERPGAGRGLVGFWADIRAGLRAFGRGRMNASPDEAVRDAPAPHTRGHDGGFLPSEDGERSGADYDLDAAEEVSLELFFVGSEQAGDAYVQADDITATLERARAAVRTLHHERAAQVRSGGQGRALARNVGRSAGHVPASRHPKSSREQASA